MDSLKKFWLIIDNKIKNLDKNPANGGILAKEKRVSIINNEDFVVLKNKLKSEKNKLLNTNLNE